MNKRILVLTLVFLSSVIGTAGAQSPSQFVQGPVVLSGLQDTTVREKLYLRISAEGFCEGVTTEHPTGNEPDSTIIYVWGKGDCTSLTRFAGNPVINRPGIQDQDPSLLRLDDGSYVMMIEVNDGQEVQLARSDDGLTGWVVDPLWSLPFGASPVLDWDAARGTYVLFYEDFSTVPFSVAVVEAPTIDELQSAIPILIYQDLGVNDAIPDSVIANADGSYDLYVHIEDFGTPNFPSYLIQSVGPGLNNWGSPIKLTVADEFTAPFVYVDPASQQRRAILWNLSDARHYMFFNGEPPIVIPPVEGSFSWNLDGASQVTTVTGNPVFSTRPGGQVGASMICDGVDDSVNTGLTGTNFPQWTAAAWVLGNTPNSGEATGPIHLDDTMVFSWNHGASAWQLVAALATGGNWYGSAFTGANTSVWTHFAATYDGATLRSYVNGVLASENAGPNGAADSDGTMLRFCQHSQSGALWTGEIDQVEIFTRALTAQEIVALP